MGFKLEKEYPAENIQKVTTLIPVIRPTKLMIRIPFVNILKAGGFIIWQSSGLKRFRFIGRGISQTDAQIVLDRVYSKFPQYKS